MQYEFDSVYLSKMLKTHRIIELNIGLREVAKKSKVSAATLSRIENKETPDIKTLLKVCNWLSVAPNVFFKIKSNKK